MTDPAPAWEAVDACGCGAEELGPALFAWGFRDVRLGLRPCHRCRRLLLDPRPDAESLSGWYDSAYFGAGSGKFIGPVEAVIDRFRAARARRALGLLRERPLPSGTKPAVLDIGCGSGRFLEQLIAMGVDAYGTELSKETGSRAAQVQGLTLHTGPLEASTFERGRFQLVSIWHVLEHLQDPDRVLGLCSQWLARGGRLMLAVPNIGSWQARFFRENWLHLDPPRHLQHFDPASLRMVLDAAGFRIRSVRHLSWEQNLFGYVQSALNAIGLPRDDLYEILKGNRRFVGRRDLAQVMLAVLMLAPGVVLTLLEALSRCGGTIELAAERQDR